MCLIYLRIYRSTARNLKKYIKSKVRSIRKELVFRKIKYQKTVGLVVPIGVRIYRLGKKNRMGKKAINKDKWYNHKITGTVFRLILWINHQLVSLPTNE
jgi:hypothetical protein